MLKLAALIAVFGLSSLTGCGLNVVAPPAAPSREIPRDVEPLTSPVEPGMTRTMLDANGDRAQVVDVVDATSTTLHAEIGGRHATGYGYSETTKPLCLAPCIVDLKPGLHTLRFLSGGRESDAVVQIGERSKVVRHAMGSGVTTHFVGQIIGGALLVLGVSSIPGGLAVFAASSSGDDRPQMQTIGTSMMLGGAAATALGAALLMISRTEFQGGSTTEIPLRTH